jgi:cytoskeletal protein RodZ
MKFKFQLIVGILGLSAFVSLPAVAQTHRLENFLSSTPPSNSDRVSLTLNEVEETSDSDYTETQESTPVTPTTSTERSESRLTYSSQREYSQYPGHEAVQAPTVTPPTANDNMVNPNPNSAY